MKKTIFLTVSIFFIVITLAGQNVFSVKGEKTFLNEKEFLTIGLRCSNALISNKTTSDFIENLDVYKFYGVNTISVFFMGSRFGDVKGYNEDASLNLVYTQRMAKIIEACDNREMVVLVGCLYWGGSKGKWENWTQKEANLAVANTVKWLSENNFRNVFVDPDNEGMANRQKGFNIGEMIAAGKKVDSKIIIGYNSKGNPPDNADIALHFSEKIPGKHYIESEGTPPDYWGEYSKEKGLYEYINVGIYTKGKKQKQLEITEEHLKNGMGYIFASTWLQNVPPNPNPGRDGTPENPGIMWWLENIKKNYGK